MWSGDKKILHNRYCTPYTDFDIIYIDIGESDDLLAAERRLHTYLRKAGKWINGEVFHLCYDEIKQYCEDVEPTFELSYEEYRMKRSVHGMSEQKLNGTTLLQEIYGTNDINNLEDYDYCSAVLTLDEQRRILSRMIKGRYSENEKSAIEQKICSRIATVEDKETMLCYFYCRHFAVKWVNDEFLQLADVKSLESKTNLILLLKSTSGHSVECDSTASAKAHHIDELLAYLGFAHAFDHEKSLTQEEANELAKNAQTAPNAPSIFKNYSKACKLFGVKRHQPEYFKKNNDKLIEAGSSPHVIPTEKDRKFTPDGKIKWDGHSFIKVASAFLGKMGLGLHNQSTQSRSEKGRIRIPRYKLNVEKAQKMGYLICLQYPTEQDQRKAAFGDYAIQFLDSLDFVNSPWYRYSL